MEEKKCKGTRESWLFSIIKGSRRKRRRERKTNHMVGIKKSLREKIKRNHSLQKPLTGCVCGVCAPVST